MARRSCENCGCAVYNDRCTNCHEALYIMDQYEELAMKLPPDDSAFMQEVREASVSAERSRRRRLMREAQRPHHDNEE
jgi:RNA polymerase subunit RPABC4/transcription elongation factor Spt4